MVSKSSLCWHPSYSLQVPGTDWVCLLCCYCTHTVTMVQGYTCNICNRLQNTGREACSDIPWENRASCNLMLISRTSRSIINLYVIVYNPNICLLITYSFCHILCPGMIWLLHLGVGSVFSSSRLINMLSFLMHSELVCYTSTWPCLRGIFTSFSWEDNFWEQQPSKWQYGHWPYLSSAAKYKLSLTNY